MPESLELLSQNDHMCETDHIAAAAAARQLLPTAAAIASTRGNVAGCTAANARTWVGNDLVQVIWWLILLCYGLLAHCRYFLQVAFLIAVSEAPDHQCTWCYYYSTG